jgi:hypothetical protein
MILALTRPSWSGVRSTLSASTTTTAENLSAAALLQFAVERSRGATIEPLSVVRWDRYHPGAVAIDFRVTAAGSDSVPGFGTAVAAPLPNGRVVLFDLRYDATDGSRKWDVARALQLLPRYGKTRL